LTPESKRQTQPRFAIHPIFSELAIVKANAVGKSCRCVKRRTIVSFHKLMLTVQVKMVF
jgi:hypothetical protein